MVINLYKNEHFEVIFMGIVRNLVVRFKNWYKDLVNNGANNMNAREVTDDVKLRDNSKGKRPLAGLVALVLMATPVLGLTEDSEVEITSSTKLEDQMKGNPNELTKEEQQILVQTVIQDIEVARSEFASKIQNSYYEWVDLNKSLDEGNLRELIPVYLFLNDDYDNVELIRQLIDNNLITEEELCDYDLIKSAIFDIHWFNLREKDAFDINFLVRNPDQQKEFMQCFGDWTNYNVNYKKEKKELAKYLPSFMEQVISEFNRPNKSTSEKRKLYVSVDFVKSSIRNIAGSNSDCRGLIDVMKSSEDYLKPAKGEPFVWKDEKNSQKALLGAYNDLAKMGKVLAKEVVEEDAIFFQTLASSDELIDEQR